VKITLTDADEILIVRNSLSQALECLEDAKKGIGVPVHSYDLEVERRECERDIEALKRVLGMY